MIKSLLTSVALVATVLTANAQDYELSLSNLGSGYDSSYDADTKTITFDGAWKGRGWWLGSFDASNYSEVVINFEPTDIDVKIVVEYVEEGASSSESPVISGNVGTVSCLLNSEYKNAVSQIYIQNSKTGSLTLTDAYLKMAENVTLVPLWSGECDLGTDWKPSDSFAIPASDLNSLPDEEAKLIFTYTSNPNCDYSQIKLASNAEGWAPLEISTELGNSYKCIALSQSSTSLSLTLKGNDIATIKANGLRVQGYGATITKVELVTEGEVEPIDPNLLWSGTCDFGTKWESSFDVQKTKFSKLVEDGEIDAEEGVTLMFTYEANEGVDYAQFKLASNADWAPLEISKNLGSIEYQCINLPMNKTVYSLTLNAADLKTVMENGLRVQGYGATVTEVKRVDYDSYLNVPAGGLNEIADIKDAPVSPLYQYDVTYSDMPGFGKGSGIVVFYNVPEDASITASFFESKETDAGDAVILTPAETNHDACYVVLALTDEQREAIALNGSFVHIEGTEGDITVCYTKGEEITGIADITVDENAPVEYFNLQGIKISADDATNGIFIRRQGGKSVKVAR